MSKRFGKGRVPNCKCEYNFTCKACLLAAPSLLAAPTYYFTPDKKDGEGEGETSP